MGRLSSHRQKTTKWDPHRKFTGHKNKMGDYRTPAKRKLRPAARSSKARRYKRIYSQLNNTNSTYSKTMRKRRSRKTRLTLRKVSKQASRAMQKAKYLASPPFTELGYAIKNSAAGNVNYSVFFGNNASGLNLEYHTKLQVLGNTDAGVTRVETLDPQTATARVKLMKYSSSIESLWKNNTNFAVDLDIMIFKALRNTNISPVVEMEEAYANKYSRITTTLAADPFCNVKNVYPRGFKKSWKLVKINSFSVQGGQEFKNVCVLPYATYNAFQHLHDTEAPAYVKGQYLVVLRQAGKLSHDAAVYPAVPTLAGLGPSSLDVHFRATKRWKFELGAGLVKPALANNMVSLIDPFQSDQFAPLAASFQT